MELREALDQISQIRGQMAQALTFRGYRSLTVGVSGALAVAAAIVQSLCVPQAADRLDDYLTLWIAVAAFSVGAVGGEMGYRAAVVQSALARRHTLLAIEAFAPSIVVGALVTIVIQRQPAAVWMLPGLWSLIFSLGIFASLRLMPRATLLGGLYYLAAGMAALAWGQGDAALAPWTMALCFGGGQLLNAAILYFSLERGEHDQARE